MREYCALMDRFREREEAAFLRAGIIASTIANCNRDPEKTPEPFTPQDFNPFAKPKREKTAEEIGREALAELRLLNSQFGGIDLTQGG